jgi:hypothetical protein
MIRCSLDRCDLSSERLGFLFGSFREHGHFPLLVQAGGEAVTIDAR